MTHNTRAIRLYERMGFSVEGRRSECLVVDGQFIDELTMATLLPTAPATPLPLVRLPPYPSPRLPRRHPRPAGRGQRVGVPLATFLRTPCATDHVTEAQNRGTSSPQVTSRPHVSPRGPACAPPARVPLRRRPARGPLMKTVTESRHPFVHVFLMAAQ
jgi:hypothetical protein